jgi:outer membrane protein TolC
MSQTLALMQSQMSSVCAPAGSFAPSAALLGNTAGANGTPSGLLYNLLNNTTLLPNTVATSGLEEAMVTLIQAPTEVLTFAQQIAYAASSQAALALDRLGVVPSDEVIATAKLDTGISRAFRNGITGSLNVHWQSVSDTFKDKSLDAAFGGKGLPIRFDSSVLLSATIPLARGRGRVAFEAPERAADLNLTADRAQMRQTAQEEVFRTVLAYLTLVGVQSNVKALEESSERQQQIFQLSQQLVTAGDVAAAELDRGRAHAAQVAASLSEARGSLVDARISLAEAMGVDVDLVANAPLANGVFSEELAPVPDVDSLTRAALSTRGDVRALAALGDSAQVLYAGALANARPRFDLSVSGGMGTFYEDPTFVYLPDELNPVFSLIPSNTPAQVAGNPVRFGSPLGYARAWFDGTWKPIFKANLTVDLPFRNNRLAGQATQAEAALDRARVQQQNLTRVIRENIVSETGTLKLDGEAVQRQQDLVAASQATLDASIARFQTNDITLIDLLLTEESLTQARLSLAAARQKYLSDLARLRFETGTLVSVDGETLTPDRVRFDPSFLVK